MTLAVASTYPLLIVILVAVLVEVVFHIPHSHTRLDFRIRFHYLLPLEVVVVVMIVVMLVVASVVVVVLVFF